MSKRKSKDKLEHLFHKSFHPSKESDKNEDWNIPSSDTWEHIKLELKAEEKPERKIVYWNWIFTAASILLCLSVFQSYWYNRKIKGLSDEITRNEVRFIQLQDEIQLLNGVLNYGDVQLYSENKLVNLGMRYTL